MIGRSTDGRMANTIEAETPKVEFVNEDPYDADRIVISDAVVQAFGQQRDLGPRLRRIASCRGPKRRCHYFGGRHQAIYAFSHSLGRVLPTAEVGYPVAELGGQLSGG